MYIIAVNRLINNTTQTIISIGGDDGLELFHEIIKLDPDCPCQKKGGEE